MYTELELSCKSFLSKKFNINLEITFGVSWRVVDAKLESGLGMIYLKNRATEDNLGAGKGNNFKWSRCFFSRLVKFVWTKKPKLLQHLLGRRDSEEREVGEGGIWRMSNIAIRWSTNLQVVTDGKGEIALRRLIRVCVKRGYWTKLQSRCRGGWMGSGCWENVSLSWALNATKFAWGFCTHLNSASILLPSVTACVTASRSLLKKLKKSFQILVRIGNFLLHIVWEVVERKVQN